MKKLIIAAIVLTVLVVACGEEEGVTPGTEPEGERIEPVTPACVLRNVKEGFTYRQFRIVNVSLADDFEFYFDSRDVGRETPYRNYVIPEKWDRSTFMKVIKELLRLSYYLKFTIHTEGVGDPGESAETHYAGDVRLRLLVMIDEISGFIAENGYCDFEFGSFTSPLGKKYWELKAWRDFTYPEGDNSPGVTPTSVGYMMAVFY